jgi:hypothetical protein
MGHKTLLASLFAATTLASMAGAANAAPLGAAPQAAAGVTTQSQAEPVAYRRCWWEDGYRVCRRVGPPVYGYRTYNRYGIGTERPESYPTGSTAWWRAMDRDNRGGHGRR